TFCFFFSSRRRHTRFSRDWSSDVCSSDLVDEADLAEQLVHPCPLLRQKAGVLLVGAPVLEVDLLMGDVPVAADDVFPTAGPELSQIRHEALHEVELERLPLLAGARKSVVERDDGEVAEARFYVTAFRIDILPASAQQVDDRILIA